MCFQFIVPLKKNGFKKVAQNFKKGYYIWSVFDIFIMWIEIIAKQVILLDYISQKWRNFKRSVTDFANFALYQHTKELVPLIYLKVHFFKEKWTNDYGPPVYVLVGLVGGFGFLPLKIHCSISNIIKYLRRGVKIFW